MDEPKKTGWEDDPEVMQMLEAVERDGPEAFERYRAGLRIKVEFGVALRQIAHALKVGTPFTFDVFRMISDGLDQQITRHIHAELAKHRNDAFDEGYNAAHRDYEGL